MSHVRVEVPAGSGRGYWILRAPATNGCEPPDVGPENTIGLWENSKCFYALNDLSRLNVRGLLCFGFVCLFWSVQATQLVFSTALCVTLGPHLQTADVLG